MQPRTSELLEVLSSMMNLWQQPGHKTLDNSVHAISNHPTEEEVAHRILKGDAPWPFSWQMDEEKSEGRSKSQAQLNSLSPFKHAVPLFRQFRAMADLRACRFHELGQICPIAHAAALGLPF